MKLFKQLLAYGHDDNMGKSYADGNTAFANGESAMYLQGVWAIAEIQKANPEIDLGIFPYPIGNPAKVVSGVDLLFSISAKATPAQQEAAMKWINFLMEQGNATQYISEQKCFSAVKGVSQDEPTLAGVKDAFAAGNVVRFPGPLMSRHHDARQTAPGIRPRPGRKSHAGKMDRPGTSTKAASNCVVYASIIHSLNLF